jgi:oxaloacetate decarboxylase gamma subunit
MNDEIIKLLLESVNLLVVGMIVVFVFLTVLIGVVKLMSAVVQKFPEPVVSDANNRTTVASHDSNVISPEVVAAISAAVHQYRKK